jgi:hypothetical protein
MNLTVLAFGVWVAIVTAIWFATMRMESAFGHSGFRQTGDTSLSPKSVNWIAAIAFSVAVSLCFLVK